MTLPVRKIREPALAEEASGGRVPPSDLDAESAVLSACLLDARACLAGLRQLLKPVHFYADANRRVYETVLELDAEGKPVDIVLVAGRLRERGRLQQVGGTPYLAQLSDATPAVAHVLDHARVIVEKARQRRVVALCQRVAAEGYGDVGDVTKWAQEAAQALLELQEPHARDGAATPTSVIADWEAEGPLVRIPTGIPALDKACRGGLPVPWRVYIIGAPSAGKTMLEVATADHVARAASEAGAVVGILAVDEEPEDVTVRLLQIAGYSIAEAESREPELLRQMGAAVAGLRLRLYDVTWTIESAAADLAVWAKEQGRHGVLFVDSLQTARSASGGATPRETVEANVRATRWAATTHRLLVVATSEANRASYRNDEAAKETNDMAAGAETRAIEFGAQTLLMLRTPKDEPDTIHVRIAKNRRAYLGEFWLRLDREHHRVTECDDPSADPDRVATRAQEQRQSVKASVMFDAEHLAAVLRSHPDGLGERALRGELRAQGFSWGTARLSAAKAALASGHAGCRLVEVSHGQGKPKVSKLEFDVPQTG